MARSTRSGADTASMSNIPIPPVGGSSRPTHHDGRSSRPRPGGRTNPAAKHHVQLTLPKLVAGLADVLDYGASVATAVEAIFTALDYGYAAHELPPVPVVRLLMFAVATHGVVEMDDLSAAIIECPDGLDLAFLAFMHHHGQAEVAAGRMSDQALTRYLRLASYFLRSMRHYGATDLNGAAQHVHRWLHERVSVPGGPKAGVGQHDPPARQCCPRRLPAGAGARPDKARSAAGPAIRGGACQVRAAPDLRLRGPAPADHRRHPLRKPHLRVCRPRPCGRGPRRSDS